MSAFDTHQTGNLVLRLRAPDLRRRGGEHQVVRMPLNRAIDRIDHVERAPRRAAVLHVPGLYIKRKEFCVEAALLHPLDAGAIRDGRIPTEIVIVVCHRRRHVIMGVNDNCATMNLKRSLPERFITS